MSKLKDLSGMTFGRLKAKEIVRINKSKGAIWRCECSCGGEKEVPSSRLTGKKTQSCGCLVREAKERSNITGQRFGKLVAVCFDHMDEKHKPHWLFQCDCGSQKVLPIGSVKWGRVQSCGCLAKQHITELNRQDLTGQAFGRLTAIRPTEDRDTTGSVIWECACQCGGVTYQSVNVLRGGRVKSCGCLYRETRAHCSEARHDLHDGTAISSLVAAKRKFANNTSGHTGVHLDKRTGRWVAYINLQNKRYHLGSFPELDDAIKVRETAEDTLHTPLIEAYWRDLTPDRQSELLAHIRAGKHPILSEADLAELEGKGGAGKK